MEAYKIHAKIRHGPFSTVWLARDVADQWILSPFVWPRSKTRG